MLDSLKQLASLAQLDTQLGRLAELGSQLDPSLGSTPQPGSITQPGSLGSLARLSLTSLAATQLGSLQGSTALPDLMPKHASLMQLDMLPFAHALGLLHTQPFAHALGLTTQLASLGSLALLGLTALEVLTQQSSIQDATLLPDLMTQHASLMQLDMLPLANKSLTSMTATRFASVWINTMPQLSSTRYSARLQHSTRLHCKIISRWHCSTQQRC